MSHRRLPTLPRLLTQAVLTTLALTAGGALVVMGSAGVADSPDRGAAERLAQSAEPVPSREASLMKRFECSTTGFGPEGDPRSALVRGQGGTPRVLSFDEGWAIHTSGHDDLTLVAFCLADPPETVD